MIGNGNFSRILALLTDGSNAETPFWLLSGSHDQA